MSDCLLVREYKKGNRDAEVELMTRYRVRSICLSKEIMEFCAVNGEIEIQDLVNIGMLSAYIATKNYNETCKFYTYWKKIASMRMIDEIKKTRLEIRSMFLFGSTDEHCLIGDPSIDDEDSYREDLENIFKKRIYKFKEEDKKMFFMLLDGYSIKEIAEYYHLSYQAIRYRLVKIKDKLSNILFNLRK